MNVVVDYESGLGHDTRWPASVAPNESFRPGGLANVAEVWAAPDLAEALASRDVAAIYRFLQGEGVSQRRIASLIGQSQSEVSEILGGRVVMSYPVLERIAVGLGIPRGLMGLAYDGGAGEGLSSAPLSRPAPVIVTEPGQQTNLWCHVFFTPSVFDAQKAVSVCAVLRASLRRQTDGVVTAMGRWTGLECRALRVAMRMDFRRFAGRLGVSSRVVCRWEAGGIDVCPRAESQALLDTCLRLASRDAQQRFTVTLEALLEALTVLRATPGPESPAHTGTRIGATSTACAPGPPPVPDGFGS